ncbi:TolC family protein [Alphaproteobacteria bacterium KMM 3653]|uniref:TolC family protein n=1 Tax=Harenicola maris TaxID=2841044 RepID=A0AAP2CNS1_9RHOB|nr:TolC family protein [Harenicola maris]
MFAGTSEADADASRADASPAETLTAEEANESVLIQSLLSRSSMLRSGTNFDKVAEAVLAANSRPAEASLRAAKLRAVAASKNWLPTLGPTISLTSLGDVVTQILIEQVIFDNGRKKAERLFAKADVEVAAVALAEETNERVYTALSLFVAAQQAREEAGVSQQALERVKHFEWIMNERVNGGVSDMSELNVIQHKRSEIEADLLRQNEAIATAMAELNAMSASSLSGLSGISEVSAPGPGREPLGVLRAQAEKERDVAQATVDRAAFLPKVSASSVLSEGGASKPGLTIESDNGFGFGTGNQLQAIEAVREGAERRVVQAREDAARRVASLNQRLASLVSQGHQTTQLAAQARANYDLFAEQYEAGHRQVMDVVNVFENYTAAEQTRVTVKYQIALARLEIGNILGVLVDGSDI